MRTFLLAVTLALLSAATAAVAQQPNDRNVILVVTDGLRWQEVFKGADSALVFADTTGARQKYWRATPEQRRRALMPFLWDTIGKHGQIFGNRELGSAAVVTNGLKFSYPGYNEMLTGFADPRIDKNEFGPNPNVTVFEWLNGFPSLRGHVAAFATWETFGDIFARKRAGIHTHFGWERPYAVPGNPRDAIIKAFHDTAKREWANNAVDGFIHTIAYRFLQDSGARAAFIGYGETDEWAHAGRYGRTLDAARNVDSFLGSLWWLIQNVSYYRNKTTLIVTTDHGRGRTARDWTNHGRTTDGAEEMWIAVIGPDTPALGERSGAPTVTQAQIASTIAALIGLDYVVAQPRAARPIADVIKR